MPLIGRPEVAKSLPTSLRTETVIELLAVIDTDDGSSRRTDWAECDRAALVLTSLLAGLRADELRRANVGDIRTTDEGGVIHVRVKGGTDRRIPYRADSSSRSSIPISIRVPSASPVPPSSALPPADWRLAGYRSPVRGWRR